MISIYDTFSSAATEMREDGVTQGKEENCMIFFLATHHKKKELDHLVLTMMAQLSSLLR